MSAEPSYETQAPPDEPSIGLLRELLLGDLRRQLADLEARHAHLDRRFTDDDALIARIAPVMGDAIRHAIRESREEMVEALYPIIGQLVVRAVAEAVRELARSVDARMRSALRPGAYLRQWRARLSGVSGGELALRQALPFQVAEVFLIHRESGLLLSYLTRDPVMPADMDVISGMLVAIRDFTADAFGRGQSESLDEIQYGQRRVLIEATELAYLATVVDGYEPMGYRAQMRTLLTHIQAMRERDLRRYDGDAGVFADVSPELRALMGPTT